MVNDFQAINRAREQARGRALDLSEFDYTASAELFPSRGKRNSGNIMYKRFSTAAEALRFAVEELPPPALLGAYLEVDEVRFGFKEMHGLYENAAYPLTRRTTAD
jgi:hypothetical protein